MHFVQNNRYGRPSDAQAAADAIPILVDNTYHLFHLATPPHTIHHPPRLRSSWFRLRSTDLQSWTRDSKAVLVPGESSSDPDSDGVWTGSAIVDARGNMEIFYTGYNLSEGGRQVILRASADDRHGTSFTKTGKTPIRIVSPDSNRAAFEDIDFRDPYVFFNEEESRYWMLVGTRLSSGPKWTRGCLALLTSPDLQDWSLEPEPFYAPNDMYCPECPELFSLPNGKWYLVYSRFAAPDAGTVYRMADSPYGPFHKPKDGSQGRLDGRRWYAAKSCPKASDPSKRIYFGWAGDFNRKDGKWLWGGDMALPREVSADEDGYLRIDPVEEAIAASFGNPIEKRHCLSNPSIRLSSIGNTITEVLDVPIKAESLEYMLEFGIGPHDAQSFGLLFRSDADMRSHRISFIPRGNGTMELTLLTDLPPLDDFWADQYQLYLPRNVDGPEIVRHCGLSVKEKIRLIVSGELIQLFCGGRSITFRVAVPRPSGLSNGAVNGAVNGTANGAVNGTHAVNGDHAVQSIKELAFFVEDGKVDFEDVRLSRPSIQ